METSSERCDSKACEINYFFISHLLLFHQNSCHENKLLHRHIKRQAGHCTHVPFSLMRAGSGAGGRISFFKEGFLCVQAGIAVRLYFVAAVRLLYPGLNIIAHHR